MTETPEQSARRAIGANLEAAGWLVQDLDELDLSGGPCIAAREFPMKPGFGSADSELKPPTPRRCEYADGRSSTAVRKGDVPLWLATKERERGAG